MQPPESPLTSDREFAKPSAMVARLGLLSILLSGVFFFSMLSVPWWPLNVGVKAIIGSALFVGMQVAWWGGVAMTGPAAVGAMTAWFRRK